MGTVVVVGTKGGLVNLVVQGGIGEGVRMPNGRGKNETR